MSKFYVLNPGAATRYYFLDLDLASMEEAASDWSYRQLASFKGTAHFGVEKGTTPADFLDTNCALIVVSDRVIDLLQKHNLNGYATYDVRVMKGGNEIEGYRGLAIVGRGGPNEPSLVTHYKTSSGASSRRISGIRPTAWDGSSLFTVDDLYRIVLVTEDVKSMFEREKITNCIFQPAEDFSIGY